MLYFKHKGGSSASEGTHIRAPDSLGRGDPGCIPIGRPVQLAFSLLLAREQRGSERGSLEKSQGLSLLLRWPLGSSGLFSLAFLKGKGTVPFQGLSSPAFLPYGTRGRAVSPEYSGITFYASFPSHCPANPSLSDACQNVLVGTLSSGPHRSSQTVPLQRITWKAPSTSSATSHLSTAFIFLLYLKYY